MTHSCFSFAERLEERIAPAGFVTATFANGQLEISGADGADHSVNIFKTGANTFRVEGNATGIDEVGQMSKDFVGKLKHVLIEGGTGADTFAISKLRPLKSLGFDGGAGVDSLTMTKLKTGTGGRVDIALGSETGSITFDGGRTSLHGPLNMDLGGGGTATFMSTLTTIDDDVTVTGGSGADVFAITAGTTVFKQNLTVTAGDGNDSFVATGDSLKVAGTLTMDGGTGTDDFAFAADSNIFGTQLNPGVVDLRLGEGQGSVRFLGFSTKVFGEVKIDLGSGGGMAQLHSERTTDISRDVQVTGGVGNDSLGLQGAVSIGKMLSFVGDAGDDVFGATGSLLAVQGATTMDGGTGATTFDLNVISLALAAVTVTGGTSNDTISIVAGGTIAGDVSLQLGLDGTGPSSTILQSRAGIANGLAFGKTLTIDMQGATVDVLRIANIQVAKAFVAQTGENVSTVDISNLDAKSEVTLRTGSGADVVNIDNLNARGLEVDTESGADELRIERNATFTGTSRITGTATVLTGIGADQIRIGNSSDPANLNVSFTGQMTLEAGDGANMRNDIVGSNGFRFAPTVIATGGDLTQTEAV